MSVKPRNRSAAILVQCAVQAHRAGRLKEAERLYQKALESDPRNFDALHLLGVACLQSGKLQEAETWIRQALKVNTRSPEARNHLGMALSRQGQVENAIAEFQAALGLNAAFADARHNLATAHKRLGRMGEAIAHYREAARISPHSVLIHYNLGVALHEQGRLDEAIAAYRKALRANPDYAEAHCNLGGALQQQGQLTEAVGCYERALALNPNYADARSNLGVALEHLGRLPEAVACYSEAIRLNPDYAEAYSNLGAALGKQGRAEDAIVALKNAIRIKPEFATASYNLGNTLVQQGRLSDALDCYEQALKNEPNNSAFLLSYLHVAHQLARWHTDAVLSPRLCELGPPRRNPRSPFPALALSDSADFQKWLAIAFAASEQHLAQIWRGEPAAFASQPDKLRIGYFSADFKNHPVSHLIAETLELHDKAAFDIVCYCFGQDDGSSVRKRIAETSTEFHDVFPLSPIDTARKIHADRIQILVDLMGYTSGSRSSVLAMRPAPIQVNWLGYPGTLGNRAVDYIIADEFIIPHGSEQFYVEKPIRLPDTTLPTDRKRVVAEPLPRSNYGLPERATVFCCFNQIFKILPDTFTLWMEILAAVPESVLWLSQGNNEEVAANLRREASARGVAPARLIFAPRLPTLAEHLARYRVTHLALDTYPYTSHTTAADALWAGCPLLTRVGETFASRVAGSMLHAAGLPQLIASSAEEFRSLAIRLGQTSAELEAIRATLTRNRDTCRLFDTPRFVKHLEAAYRQAWESFCSVS